MRPSIQLHLFCDVCKIYAVVRQESIRANHLHENIGGKFPSNGAGIFLAPKTGTGLSCTIYKIPLMFSLSLDMKLGTSNAKSKQIVQKISVISVKTGKR